jgi:hypothetical protein
VDGGKVDEIDEHWNRSVRDALVWLNGRQCELGITSESLADYLSLDYIIEQPAVFGYRRHLASELADLALRELVALGAYERGNEAGHWAQSIWPLIANIAHIGDFDTAALLLEVRKPTAGWTILNREDRKLYNELMIHLRVIRRGTSDLRGNFERSENLDDGPPESAEESRWYGSDDVG